jgi:CheY-like chemotaxis protein
MEEHMDAQCTRGILLVEDDPNDAEIIQMALRQTGVLNPVTITRNATDAVAYLQGSTPYTDRRKYPPIGILLLDLKLPGMDGFAFLEWLKNQPQFNDMLIVVVSGLDDLASIRRAYALGADSFLAKPSSALDVENLIQWFPGYWTRSAKPAVPVGMFEGDE